MTRMLESSDDEKSPSDGEDVTSSLNKLVKLNSEMDKACLSGSDEDSNDEDIAPRLTRLTELNTEMQRTLT